MRDLRELVNDCFHNQNKNNSLRVMTPQPKQKYFSQRDDTKQQLVEWLSLALFSKPAASIQTLWLRQKLHNTSTPKTMTAYRKASNKFPSPNVSSPWNFKRTKSIIGLELHQLDPASSWKCDGTRVYRMKVLDRLSGMAKIVFEFIIYHLEYNISQRCGVATPHIIKTRLSL